MLRIITRIQDIRIPYKIYCNKIRFYCSANKNIRKSNTSTTKKHPIKYNAFTDNSRKGPEGGAGSISFVAYDSKKNIFIGGFLLVPQDSKADIVYGNTLKQEQSSDIKKQKDFTNVDGDRIIGDMHNIKKVPDLSVFFKDVKSTQFFYGNISQSDRGVNQNSKSQEQKNFSKFLKHYIPSVGTLRESFKKAAKNSSSIVINIKIPAIPIAFFWNMLKSGKKLKQSNEEKQYKENEKENVLHEAENSTKNSQPLWNTDEQIECPGSVSSEYVSDQIKNVGNILHELNGNISNEEKYEFLLKWREGISNIYCTIKDLNTATSAIVLSQCSKYSEILNSLITSISEDEDYAKLVPLLTCITVVSIQLLLFSYINIPCADQVVSVAVSLYHKAHLLKDDPNFHEVINATMKKIEELLPVNLDTLQLVDWGWYFKMTGKASLILNLVIKSWKESRMEFPVDESQ